MTSEFWRGRRVFLTGHTGFKGAWLALWLQHLGAEVTGYALPPVTDPNLFELAKVSHAITSHYRDIRDLDAITNAMRDAEPEIVFHLAAQALVRRSYIDPVATYATNVMGTINVFEAVRRTQSVKAVVNVTSDKAYENPEWNWACREIDPMGGRDPYSSSKGCAELVTSAYRRSFFSGAKGERQVAVASARAGNVIGGGDWAEDRLLPDVVRGLSSKISTVIRNPDSIRPWQHVLEPLSGYMILAERLISDPGRYADGWNFGPNDLDAVPVKTVLEIFTAALGGRPLWHVNRDSSGPHEAHILRLDTAKARIELGWQPRWRLETGVRRTAEWYEAHLSGEDMRAFTLLQIKDFESA